MTHGEAYAANRNGYRDKHDRAKAATRPIHAEVARLQARGLSAEQAWARVMARVSS